MRTIAPSLPACDLIDNPRLVLRDGTVASVRVAEPSDREAMRHFFHELSPDHAGSDSSSRPNRRRA